MEVIKNTIEITRKLGDYTNEQIMDEVFKNITMYSMNKKETEVSEKETKKKIIKGPRKPAEDEVRCMARVFKKGKPVVMREDPLNQYGDRCIRKKKDDSDFCTAHTKAHECGIWNGDYGKMNNIINANPTKEKKEEEPCQIPFESESDNDTEQEEETQSVEVDTEPIIIDGKNYNIDSSGIVYDDNDEIVGKYNVEKKKWISKKKK